MQVWRTLGGPYYEHVTLNNLRMLLLAIKGIHVQPDLGLDCGQTTDDENDGSGGQVRMQDLITPQGKLINDAGAPVFGAPHGSDKQSNANVDEDKENKNDSQRRQRSDRMSNNSKLKVSSESPFFGVFNRNADFYMFEEDVDKA